MIATTDTVTISGKIFTYQKPWDGHRLAISPGCPYVALDTETEVVDLKIAVPRLAMAAASVGRQHVVIHPDQVADFICKGRNRPPAQAARQNWGPSTR
jgi:hypothetical protein